MTNNTSLYRITPLLTIAMGVVFLIILIIILAVLSPIVSAAKLHIDDGRDTAYLPYKYVEEHYGYGDNIIGVYEPVFLFNPEPNEDNNYEFVFIRNDGDWINGPAIFTHEFHPSHESIDDDPVNLVVQDCFLHDEPDLKTKSMIATGLSYDTAWVIKLFPESDSINKLILTTGKDSSGDGIWKPNIYFLLAEDYDYDGDMEAFVTLSTGRELTPRMLYCVNCDNLNIEWELEVSSVAKNMLSCRDSLNPAIVFTTANNMQGTSDANYDDRFKFISKVNSSGEIMRNTIISSESNSAQIIRAEVDGLYYVIHDLPFLEPDSVYRLIDSDNHDLLERNNNYISKIDDDFNVHASVMIDDAPMRLLLYKFPEDQNLVLLTSFRSRDNFIRAYSTSLEFVAESNPTPLSLVKIGEINLPGHRNALVFIEGVYSRDFKLLMKFPEQFSKIIPFDYDKDSNVVRVALSISNTFSLGRIEKKKFTELLSVFYHNNQVYILMLISGLVVGMLVMNFYRYKTKRNLVTIRDQKMELDKTYLKLKEAQAKIVAQEKYRQAQDIAGGFAHEIRNALSPARHALSKLIETDSRAIADPAIIQKLSRFSDRAVERALKLTRAISQYTKIEDIHNPEAVDLKAVIEKILEMNHHRIKSQKVKINVAVGFRVIVMANTDQLRIVFNNLLLNSLDALTDTENPDILIETHVDGQNVEVTFRDNGSGITPDSLERIFDVFYSTKPSGGTGIGLTMVKKIIESYGGSISVDSKLNEFTACRILLKKYTD